MLTPVASVQPPPAAEATRVCVVRVTSVVAALARQPPVDTPILQLPTQLSSALPLAPPAQTGTLNRRKLTNLVQNHYYGYFEICPRPSTTISTLRYDENDNLLLFFDNFCSCLFIALASRKNLSFTRENIVTGLEVQHHCRSQECGHCAK